MTPMILATLLLASPVDCREYLEIRAESRPVFAMRIDTKDSTLIRISDATVALQCVGNEYRATLLKF